MTGTKNNSSEQKAARRPGRHRVCTLRELPPGERKMVSVAAFGRSLEIGVFNVHGKLVAYRNVCPHAGAPVCVGKICGTTLPSKVSEFHLARQGEILRCPWHGWEFDLLTGAHLVDETTRLRSYPVDTGSEALNDESLESYPVETENEVIYLLV